MIELLYAVIIVVGIAIFFFCISPSFQFSKLYFYSFELLVWILLVSLNQYKKNYLWDEPDFKPIQELPYPPINDIITIKDSNSQVRDIKVTYSKKVYSLIETKEYPKKCMNNYYIPQSETCPITDIIVDYSGTSTYSDYEKIEINNGNIYYKRYQKGKFYDSIRIDMACSNKYIIFDNKYKTIKFSYSYDYQNIEAINRLEEHKLLKPFKNFKDYKNTTDFICLFIIIFSFIYVFMESKKDNKWNYFKIIDNSLQLILFILYLIRFILFGKVKQFFKENESLYNNEDLKFDRTIYFINYFPKSLSINSFPLAISIVIIFFFLLSLVLDNKCRVCEDNSTDDKYGAFNDDKKLRIIILYIPFMIIYFICFILDIINDQKIKKIYKNTIDNWDTSPITSIEINSEKKYELGHIFSKEKEFYFYSWKYNYFTIKRNSDYNYMNIYSNDENKKICGKDSFGNSLYFPQNVECPINDIFILNNDSIDYPEYTKINLGLNNYLYYSNKKVDKNIIIDIKVGFPKVPLELSTEKTNELYNSIYDKGFCKEIGEESLNYYKFNTIPFYKEIDHWDLYDFLESTFGLKNINYIGEISLYSLTYQGFSSNSNIKKDIIKYKKDMNNFISLSIVKSIFSSFNILYFTIFSVILTQNNKEKCNLYISIVFIGLLLFHFIIVMICLSFNVIYIQNIMNRINNDFDRKRNNYSWILSTFFLDIIFMLYYIAITYNIFEDNIKDTMEKLFFCCKKNKNDKNNNYIKSNEDGQNSKKSNHSRKNNKKIKRKNNNTKNNNTKDNYESSRNVNKNTKNNNTKDSNESNRSENKNTKPEEGYICIICCKERPSISFGCGHLCYCLKCYNKEEIKNKNECPICGNKIDTFLKIISIKE